MSGEFVEKSKLEVERFEELNSLYFYYLQYSQPSFLQQQNELGKVVPWEVTYSLPQDDIQVMTVRYSQNFLRINDLSKADFPQPLFVFHLNTRNSQLRFNNPVTNVDINIYNSISSELAPDCFNIDLENGRAVVNKRKKMPFKDDSELDKYLNILVPKSEDNWKQLVKLISTDNSNVPVIVKEAVVELGNKDVSELSIKDINDIRKKVRKNEFRMKRKDIQTANSLIEIVDIIRQDDFLKATNFFKSSTPWLQRRTNIRNAGNLVAAFTVMFGVGTVLFNLDETLDQVDPKTPQELFDTMANATFFDSTYYEAINLSQEKNLKKYYKFLTSLVNVTKNWGGNEVKVNNIVFPNLTNVFSLIYAHLNGDNLEELIVKDEVSEDLLEKVEIINEPDEKWEGDNEATKGFLKNLLNVFGYCKRALERIPTIFTENTLDKDEAHYYTDGLDFKLPSPYGHGMWHNNPTAFFSTVIHEFNHGIHFKDLISILKEISLEDYAELIGLQYGFANSILESWLIEGPDSFPLFSEWMFNTNGIKDYEYVQIKNDLNYPQFAYYVDDLDKDINEFMFWCLSKYKTIEQSIENKEKVSFEDKIFLQKYYNYGIGNWAINHTMHHLLSIIPANTFNDENVDLVGVSALMDASRIVLFQHYCKYFLKREPEDVIKDIQKNVLGSTNESYGLYSSKGNLWVHKNEFISREGYDLFERANDGAWFLNSNIAVSQRPQQGEIVVYPSYNSNQSLYNYYCLDIESPKDRGQIIEVDNGLKSGKSFKPKIVDVPVYTSNGEKFGVKSTIVLEHEGNQIHFPINFNTSGFDLTAELNKIKVVTSKGVPVGVKLVDYLLPDSNIQNIYGTQLIGDEGVIVSFTNYTQNVFGIMFQSTLFVLDSAYEEIVRKAIVNKEYIGLAYQRESDNSYSSFLILHDGTNLHRLPIIRGSN